MFFSLNSSYALQDRVFIDSLGVVAGRFKFTRSYIHVDHHHIYCSLAGVIVAAGSNTETALRECLDAVLTPATIAAGGTAVVESALTHRTVDGYTPLASAAITGHKANLRLIITATQAHLDNESLWRALTHANVHGATVLHHAAAFSHPRAFATLIGALESASPSAQELQVCTSS